MKKLLLLFCFLLFSIMAYSQDVWLQNHFSPNSGLKLSNMETVTVLVNNNSGVIMPSNTITVKYQVDNGTIITQLLSSNLTAGASWNFSFNVKANLSAFGAHIIKVWVERPGDNNSLNNELTWTVNNTCIEMNQPANVNNICGGTTAPAINFTSHLANVGYTWTNSNPAIGLAASGFDGIPSFTTVNTGTSPLTSTITVRPRYIVSQTFDYTGTMQTYIVPAGVTKIKIDAKGAQGGSAIYNQPGTKPDDLGGKGGRVMAEYPVTPGQTIYVFVGGNAGFNGGGSGGGSIAQSRGGDASDIRIGGMLISDRVIVAGGGGGGGNNCSANPEPGGAGGGLIGETGYQCGDQSGPAVGQGGTQTQGGAAGTSPSTPGTLGFGGNAGGQGTASGGGGGGYYGGGGAAFGGGGGGSSYTGSLATSVAHTQGFQDGLGQIIISYYSDECGGAYDKTFTITVKPQPVVSSLTPANQIIASAQAIAVITPVSSLTGTAFSWTRDNDVNVTGVPTSGNGVISGSLTNATNTPQTVTFTVTPSTNGCVGTPVTATVLVKLVQNIGAIANIAKNYGDADFELVATASSGLTVSYASSDNNIAEAYQDAADNNKWKLKIKKGGAVTVTASQVGDSDYYEASPVSFTLTINKVPLTIMATAQQKVYDSSTYTGGAGIVYGNFVNNEDASVLLGTLSYSGDSQGAKNVGDYVIMPTGLSSDNYDISYQAAQLKITPFALTVSATGTNKVYDATNNAAVILSSNALPGDGITLAHTSATFNDENVANGKPVSVSGISLSGTDAGNYTFNTTASTTGNITPFALTVSATGNNKIYNATNTATVTLANNAFAGDNITLTYTSATFNDENVANGKPVSVSGISLSGTDAGNYTFNTTASATGNITPFALTVSATGNNKIYNATSNATVILASNAFAGDNITLTYTSATFNDENVANGKPVSVSGISLSGTDTGNYTFNTTASTTANITPFALTVSATGTNRVYNATSNATVTLASNAFAGDNITLAYTSATFGNKVVANGKPVSVSGISLSGTDAGNYTFNTTASTTANITPFALTVSATGNNKVYDATNNATVILASNAFAGDNITLAYTSATFGSKVVANGKPVSVSGISLSGTDAGNYTFNTTASTTANITPFALTVTATGSNKIYNGGTDATVTLSHNGFFGDVLNLNYTAASFDNRNVGNGKTVSVTGINLSGTDAVNYTIGATVVTTAAITPATLNIAAQAKAKTYGDADPALTYVPTGLIGTDAIGGSLGRTAGENVNSYPITQGTLSAGTNYVLAFTGANLTINRATLTVTAVNAARCFGQANPSFALNYSGFKLNDNENSLTSKPQSATTATASSAAGNYPITVSGGTSANYTFVYVNGNLRIDALPTIAITPSRQGTIGKGLTLQLSANGGSSYSWANAQGIISGQNSATLTIRPTTNTTYTVTVTNANGCGSTASYAVTVADDLSILAATNIISPNGDGINDVWKVDNIDMYPQSTVRIFDKAGRVLYTKKGYDNTWDGYYNGQPLAESTYYYIIDLGGGRALRGFISLVRDSR